MTPPDHVGDDPVPHAGGGSQGLSTARLTGLLNGTYAKVGGIDLGPSNGTDDTATIAAALTTAASTGQHVWGRPGAMPISGTHGPRPRRE